MSTSKVKKHIDGAIQSLEKAIDQMKEAGVTGKLPEEIKHTQSLITQLRVIYIVHSINVGMTHAQIGETLGITGPRISQIHTKYKQDQGLS